MEHQGSGSASQMKPQQDPEVRPAGVWCGVGAERNGQGCRSTCRSLLPPRNRVRPTRGRIALAVRRPQASGVATAWPGEEARVLPGLSGHHGDSHPCASLQGLSEMRIWVSCPIRRLGGICLDGTHVHLTRKPDQACPGGGVNRGLRRGAGMTNHEPPAAASEVRKPHLSLLS